VQDCVVGGNVVDFFVEEFGLVLEFENRQSKARKQFLLSQGYRVVLFKQQMKWEVFLNRLWHSLFVVDDVLVVPVCSGSSQVAGVV